jgi:hypothetical protein
MRIAKSLGMMLSDVLDRMTYDELLLWDAYFQLERDDQDAQARRRR